MCSFGGSVATEARSAVEIVEQHQRSQVGEPRWIAVHCKAGIGRTGTVLAAWLIREGGLSADAAIKRLRTIKSTYVQSEVQEQFLDLFEKDILQRQ